MLAAVGWAQTEAEAQAAWTEALKAADETLYQAKENGRNQVVVSSWQQRLI